MELMSDELFMLFTDEVACVDPEACQKICGNPSGCFDIAYPLLVLRLLPAGWSTRRDRVNVSVWR